MLPDRSTATVMSVDFWAGYVSGAVGIVVGNPLDIIKVRLQAGNSGAGTIERPTGLFRGSAAPILGYGALNSLLFVTYNRSLKLLDPSIPDPTKLAGVDLSKIWIAGVLGGLASWVVSAPSEVIKCRAQLCVDGQRSSLAIFKELWKSGGLRGLYLGGVITSLRDSIGYGFYFWSYELSKRILLSRQADPFLDATAMDVLISGGIAGVITWASIYPLDVIKTRIQTQSSSSLGPNDTTPLLGRDEPARGSLQTAQHIYRSEGLRAFYRGLGVCSVRAFIVNAVQVEFPLPFPSPY
jgi:solute carrier family 25 (mitochondrial carnitine/acylcarnitine transporter), member 20/29